MTKIQSVIPILVYEDIAAGYEYLTSVLGFEPGGLEHTPDGTVVHGEVRTSEGAVWLHRVTGDHGMQSPRALTAAHGGMSVFVDDVDAVYERVRAQGADTTSTPTDQEYGIREFGVRDPEGHHFWFSQRPYIIDFDVRTRRQDALFRL